MLDLCKGKGALLVWAAPGEEPTRHVLADLNTLRADFEHWGGTVALLLPPGTPGLGADGQGLPAAAFLGSDEGSALLATVTGAQGCPAAGHYPILVCVDPAGRMIRFSQGYQIGAGDQALRALSGAAEGQ